MAYIKYKELAHYFNFYKQLDIGTLPKYVTDYISEGEKINAVYSTLRDKCLFSDRKIILFDRRGGLFGLFENKIHFFPYNNISSSAIVYRKTSATLLFTMNSGYQLKLNFINLKPEEKTYLRKVYYKMIEKVTN